ncbi:hypothetical protein FXO38_07273 [Capsicum annuum]|nr:hypothetical protein FXO38_07273 [Capsicum annuum]
MEKREAFAIEEGLHHAIVIKLSSSAPDLKDLRTLLPKNLGIKDHSLIGSLAPRQLLRWIFSSFIDFNYKEKATKEAVWISSSNLALDLFVKRLLLPIAAAGKKPIAIDKATQVKSRPSTARIKEDGDRRPHEKNQQPGLLASSHPDVEVHNNIAKLVALNVDSQQQQIVANNNAIGDVDAYMHHIHDVVASSENSGQHSCLNVAKKSLDKNLEVDNLRSPSNSTHFEHSISEKRVTGDELANKIKGVDSSIGKDWTVVAHKKYLGIRIGSPARVNVQLARNVP